jgi:hypothetical protein
MIGDLTNHLWQSTIFAFVVALLNAALRENRAHVRYLVVVRSIVEVLRSLFAVGERR